jgi:hypothetical protein
MLFLSLAYAVEGMWLPGQLPTQEQTLKNMGLQIPVSTLSDPKGPILGSIVHVGGYCSGSFVSKDGLILTNHHCTWELLQANTTAEHNRLDNGFVAASRAEELSGGPDARLYIMEKDEDVTAAVLKKVKPRASDTARKLAIEEAIAGLLDACEAGQADRECEVTEEYGGRSYRLLTHRVLRDVRIVMAPPMTVGSFGGDLDNFEWPRHDGDFAILRAYVGKDGSSQDYSADNVPYAPPHFLKIQPQGIKPDELVLVAGFPGSTQRYELASELDFLANLYYPNTRRRLSAQEAIVAEASKVPEGAEKLGATAQELANYRKYIQGILDNVASSGVLERKKAAEAELRAWVAADEARKARYQPVLNELDTRIAEYQDRWVLRDVLRALGSSDLYTTARKAVHLAFEKEKPDIARDDGYRDRDREETVARFKAIDRGLYLPADRQFFADALQDSQKLAPNQRLAPIDSLLAGGIEPALDTLYQSPALAGVDYRLKLLDLSRKELEALKDPWIALALALEPIQQAERDRSDAYEGAMARLRPLYMEALLAFRPSTYPDANNTLRLTFGTVQGYSPRDAVLYTPQTTVQGMVAKAQTDAYTPPPDSFLQYAAGSTASPWIDPALKDVPLCFLSDLDSTGGNSGSPTLNAKGELVGLLFDGNYESMAADWLFDPATTRSIHVDIRYLLFVLDSDEKGAWIRRELVGS